MKQFIGIGIAGNFANHLEQAGEASDFHNVPSDEENAPKGIFPFYAPSHERLNRFCFNNEEIILPENPDAKVQAEPEVGLECEIIYEENTNYIAKLIPRFFMAFNDTSVRNDKNATKISQKKNFSTGCKAYGNKIPIDKFETGGICDNYSIASFIKFDNTLNLYGECSPLTQYSFFYDKLLNWTIQKLNHQQDEFVLENIKDIIQQNNHPKECVIAIGATRYTHLGETRFLQENDEVFIVVFNHQKYDLEMLKTMLMKNNLPKDDINISILRQKVVKNR